VEAMSRGVPVVTTPVGAQGLPGLGDVVGIAEDAQQLADAVVDLLATPALAAEAAQSGLAYLRRNYSAERMSATLGGIFGTSLAVAPGVLPPSPSAG